MATAIRSHVVEILRIKKDADTSLFPEARALLPPEASAFDVHRDADGCPSTLNKLLHGGVNGTWGDLVHVTKEGVVPASRCCQHIRVDLRRR